jgi:uncharacterized protein (DUF427 family)
MATGMPTSAPPTLPPPEFLTAPPRFEATPKWVRATYNGQWVADSRRAMLLWEPPRPTPLYYFPRDDVRMELLSPSDHTRNSQSLGAATYWNLRVRDRNAGNAAWAYDSPPDGAPDTRGYVAFKWDMLDAWYEEDEEVFVHPRDPHHRVDVLISSRHVEVTLGGVKVADSARPRLLFETTLPVRYYLPKLDVRMDLLEPSPTLTQCPYKGEATHWNLRGGDSASADIAWTYHLPTPECARIADLVAFYNERVDAIHVDGELQAVPQTPWSRHRR